MSNRYIVPSTNKQYVEGDKKQKFYLLSVGKVIMWYYYTQAESQTTSQPAKTRDMKESKMGFWDCHVTPWWPCKISKGENYLLHPESNIYLLF